MYASNRTGAGQLKARQDRRRVLIPARMKQGVGWTDVCIRNISPRGLLLQGQSPPRPGSYVEVRRGSYIIVARVVWTKDQEFGAHAQDLLPIEQIIRGPAQTTSGAGHTNEVPVERRSAPRPSFERSHEASRHLSSLMQYGFTVMVSLSLAGAAVAAVRDALPKPLAAAAAHL
jgi:hypothetical protein